MGSVALEPNKKQTHNISNNCTLCINDDETLVAKQGKNENAWLSDTTTET